MPRSQPNQEKSAQSIVTNDTYAKVSYTGPLMPRSSQIESTSKPFMQNVKEGVSVGIGIYLARNIVDRVFGIHSASPVTPVTPATPATPAAAVPIQPTVESMNSIVDDQPLYYNCMEINVKNMSRHELCKEFLV